MQEGREIQEVGTLAVATARSWPDAFGPATAERARARGESGELEARTGLLREAEQQHAEADAQPAWVHALQWRSGANLFEQAAQVQATTAAGGRARVEPADAERHADDHEDRKAQRKQQLRKVGGKSASIAPPTSRRPRGAAALGVGARQARGEGVGLDFVCNKLAVAPVFDVTARFHVGSSGVTAS